MTTKERLEGFRNENENHGRIGGEPLHELGIRVYGYILESYPVMSTMDGNAYEQLANLFWSYKPVVKYIMDLSLTEFHRTNGCKYLIYLIRLSCENSVRTLATYFSPISI